MNIDDPKLTAFALDELSDQEEAHIGAKLNESPEAQRTVADTQELVQMLKSEYLAELHKYVRAPANLIDIRDDPWFWLIARPLALAAVLTVSAVIAILAITWKREIPRASQTALPSNEVQTEVVFQNPESESPNENGELEPGPNAVAENPFLSVRDHPRSKFPIAVGRASYPNIEHFINEGSLPPKNVVRVGEMINYFSYDYPQPRGDDPFSLSGDVAGCPWNWSHRLVRIGVKGREIPAAERRAIARDVSTEVIFNPARVESYRLIGYEKGPVREENSTAAKSDASEIFPDHTTTALYEIVPVDDTTTGSKLSGRANELLSVKLRYKRPEGDKSESMERSIAESDATFESASPDFKFAAAVAEFGMILRDSEYKGNATLAAVAEWAQHGKSDANGYRAGFIELVRKAQALSKG